MSTATDVELELKLLRDDLGCLIDASGGLKGIGEAIGPKDSIGFAVVSMGRHIEDLTNNLEERIERLLQVAGNREQVGGGV